MKNFALHIPEGVKDYIGEEAALKELIQNKIKKVFRTNAYHLVETPSFEYLDVFTLGEESFQQSSLYHLVSRQGELMALRSDMTRAIARLIGTQKNEGSYPQRFAYLANSFRYPERYQGKLHEFTQAGVELIGNKSIAADAEVIRIAVKCLKEVGVTEFNVHVGSSPLLEYILEDFEVEKAKQEEVFKAIEAKDAVKVKSILKASQMEVETLELLLELIQCSGQIELLRTIKAKMPSSRSKAAVEEMETLYEILEDYGINEYIIFDFSLMSYGKYYTGMMFQIFTLDVGTALVEGGRYDKLLCKFGKDLPAVGFGVNINFVMQRLLKQRDLKKRQSKKTLAVSTPITRKVCQEVCDGLREENHMIENSLLDDIDASVDYAKKAGLSEVLHFKHGDKVDVYHLEYGTVEETTINQL
ncbi:MAG: ATP phosphoribosyltransferase regulatory subunit [Cellulosilyticum sp.]|nr:ATP phosphoribosyltransferase regulatory subunit [Cellulosilyticum sp.]